MQNKKGFTLLEMLVVLSILALFSILIIPKSIELPQYDFMYNYYKIQSDALVERTDQTYHFDFYPYQIRFNHLGHVESAQSWQLNNHLFIVELGCGRLVYK